MRQGRARDLVSQVTGSALSLSARPCFAPTGPASPENARSAR